MAIDAVSGATGHPASDERRDTPSPRESATGYMGPDRREPATSAFRPNVAGIAASGAAALSVWTVLGLLALQRSHAAMIALINATNSLCGALLLASAAMMFAVWRITGRARSALGAVALATAALSFPAVELIAGVIGVSADAGSLAGLVRALVKLAVIGIGVVALLSPDVVARLRPTRLVVPLALAVIVFVATLSVLESDEAFLRGLPSLVRALAAVNAAGWGLVGIAFIVTGRLRRRRSDILIGIGALVLMLGSAGRVNAAPLSAHRALIGVGITLLLVTVLTATVANMLWQLHTTRGTRLLTVSGELRSARTDLADLESDRARRLHDARNAMFAIAGATELLARPARPDGLGAGRLQRLVTSELSRLGRLLDPEISSAPRLFALRDLVEPLVTAYRVRGVQIDARVDDGHVRCRRDTLANAITNVLTNARVHAAGAHLWVAATVEYDAGFAAEVARIVIADDGPGIPAEERDAVLLPGVRGADAAGDGHGLGLASAGQALSELRGTLRLTEREGGGTVVTMTFPACVTAPEPATEPDAGAVGGRDAAPGGAASSDPPDVPSTTPPEASTGPAETPGRGGWLVSQSSRTDATAEPGAGPATTQPPAQPAGSAAAPR